MRIHPPQTKQVIIGEKTVPFASVHGMNAIDGKARDKIVVFLPGMLIDRDVRDNHGIAGLPKSGNKREIADRLNKRTLLVNILWLVQEGGQRRKARDGVITKNLWNRLSCSKYPFGVTKQPVSIQDVKGCDDILLKHALVVNQGGNKAVKQRNLCILLHIIHGALQRFPPADRNDDGWL